MTSADENGTKLENLNEFTELRFCWQITQKTEIRKSALTI